MTSPTTTTGSQNKLFPFQEDGVRALVSRPAVLLADDLGLGKTVQAITALRLILERGEASRALIVAPVAVLSQWRRMLHQWAPDVSVVRVDGPAEERAWKWRADAHVHLVSYDTCRNDIGAATRITWDLVVLDEAQRIKNRDTAVSRALKRLPRIRAWALTGTPLENREDDLASILEFTRPNPSGARQTPLFPGISLRLVHGELQLRRRKADVLTELPPKTVIRVPIELDERQRQAYEAVERAGRGELQELGERATVMNVLELITRLKQVCNFCPDSGESAKLDDLDGRMDALTASGHRALVFSQWTDGRNGVARIADGLRRFSPLTYTGAMGTGERDACIARFKEDPGHGALVLSLRAGGVGLNLQEASYVCHFDRWWNPAVENQATDRVHRMGQLNPVTAYCYVCTDTIEERIEQILDVKRALFQALVDGVSMDLGRALSPDDLFGLFGLQAPSHLRGDPRRGSPDTAQAAYDALRHAGWTVRRRPRQVPSLIDLKAHRYDEVGLDEEIWIACAEGESPVNAELVRALAARLDGRQPEGVIACVAGFTPAAQATASDLGIGLWGKQQLQPPYSAAPEPAAGT